MMHHSALARPAMPPRPVLCMNELADDLREEAQEA